MPTPRTTTARKEVLDKMEVVQVNRLKTFPGNPRRGDVDALAESLRQHGQYVPIVVQRSTSHVLKGNHTYLGAKKLKWKTIWVVYVDVDDEEAKKIVVQDNKSSDDSDNDMEALAALLSSITEPSVGTGYSESELQSLMSLADTAANEILSAPPPLTGPLGDPTDTDFGDDAMLEGEDADVYRPTDDGEEGMDDGVGEDKLEKADEELPGLIQLKEDIRFEGASFMEIPILRPDMLVEKLPEPLMTWAGMPTRNWPDPDVWWWFNYGSERTAGMNDPSKMLLAFYAYDHYFDNWYWYPQRYVSKAINTGVQYAITPNFSAEDMPRAMSLWALFRSRWLGRYMQEAGIKIIPDIEWLVGDRKYLDTYVLAGIPRELPYISIQAQNLQTNNVMKDRTDKDKAEFERKWKADLEHIVETLQPKTLIVYSNQAEVEVVRGMGMPCDVHWQKTRLMVYNELAPKRERRTTL